MTAEREINREKSAILIAPFFQPSSLVSSSGTTNRAMTIKQTLLKTKHGKIYVFRRPNFCQYIESTIGAHKVLRLNYDVLIIHGH